jgi:hypothetical protein
VGCAVADDVSIEFGYLPEGFVVEEPREMSTGHYEARVGIGHADSSDQDDSVQFLADLKARDPNVGLISATVVKAPGDGPMNPPGSMTERSVEGRTLWTRDYPDGVSMLRLRAGSLLVSIAFRPHFPMHEAEAVALGVAVQ